jgi:hypothetical protein
MSRNAAVISTGWLIQVNHPVASTRSKIIALSFKSSKGLPNSRSKAMIAARWCTSWRADARKHHGPQRESIALGKGMNVIDASRLE